MVGRQAGAIRMPRGGPGRKEAGDEFLPVRGYPRGPTKVLVGRERVVVPYPDDKWLFPKTLLHDGSARQFGEQCGERNVDNSLVQLPVQLAGRSLYEPELHVGGSLVEFRDPATEWA